MADKINIPITVTGGQAAKEEIRAVGAAAAEAQRTAAEAQRTVGERIPDMGGYPGQRPAPASPAQAVAAGTAERAAAGAKIVAGAEVAAGAKLAAGGMAAAAEKTALFTREGRTLAAVLLTQINPALGSMVLLASHVVKGVSAISLGLLPLAGVAVVLSGIVMFFQQLKAQAQAAAEAIERALAAIKAARAKGQETRGRLAEQGARAGIYGQAATMQETARALQAGGIPQAQAENAALAERIAAREGIDFDRERYLAGLAPRGMQPAEFGQGSMQDRATLRRVLQAGGAPEAQRALAAYRGDVGLAAKAAAPSMGAQREDPLDAALQRLALEHPELTAKEAQAAERIAREILPKAPEAGNWLVGHEAGRRDIFRMGSRYAIAPGKFLTEADPGLGGAASVEDIVRAARDVYRNAREFGGGSTEARAPETQPVTINITNHHQTTNVATVYSGEGGGFSRMMYESLEGGGIEN